MLYLRRWRAYEIIFVFSSFRPSVCQLRVFLGNH